MRGRRPRSRLPRLTPVPANAPPPPPAASTMELPATGIDVHQVLGKPKAQVGRVLGHANELEDATLYDDFGRTAVTVVFERGKAVNVGVSPPGYNNDLEADTRAILAWLGADFDDDEWRRIPGTVTVWEPAALERREKPKR